MPAISCASSVPVRLLRQTSAGAPRAAAVLHIGLAWVVVVGTDAAFSGGDGGLAVGAGVQVDYASEGGGGVALTPVGVRPVARLPRRRHVLLRRHHIPRPVTPPLR